MFEELIKKLKIGEDLSALEVEEALSLMMGETISEDDAVTFLTALRDKKESAEEIKGAVNFLRKKSIKLSVKSKEVMDTCGTGGDAQGSFNISTAAAFIVAGCGIPIAKRGNRAVSSTSGSSDVLTSLGVNVMAEPKVVARCIDEIGIGFLFAPQYHPLLKNVAPVRKRIGTKTIFNILGPLLNPVGATRQVIGVYDKGLLPIMASVLRDLGCISAAIVYGNDGLDEVTLTTTSRIAYLCRGEIRQDVFDPRAVGYPYCEKKELKGSNPQENALRLKQVLRGHSLPLDHCVHLNAALAIQVAGRAHDFKEALLLAQDSVSSGRAYQKLEALIEMSHS